MGAPHHSTPRKARLRGAFEAAVALNLPVSKRQLFELHGVSRRTGNRILSDLSDRTRHNQPNRPETRGRKRILKDADVNAIEDLLEKEGFEARRLPWVSMPAEAGVDTDASKRTIQRSLERRGWYKRKAQQVDYTDPKLAARRIEYAKEALAQRPEKEDWHDIFFSDETHFGYDDERDAQIARPPGTRNRPENLQEKRIPKDTEVKLLHAWACIGYNFKSPLVWYEVSTNTNGKMSQKVYLEKVLEGYVKPELLEKGVSFILEEDGDSGHGPGKNNPVRAWKEKHGLRYFFNCASSPDLSPVENCWNVVKENLRRQPHWEQSVIRDLAEEGWEKLSQETINGWIDSMPLRLQHVIELGGGKKVS
ncbi:hypothetical protein HIM_10424 [Hirsutella minnesotensis 3608]|uniref:Tc1-like transposase DDE domain-containing protein n=1 Tax=Hirsutella minnesotensis 3608 TaxID=1043627 RepID=A0A0F7ZG35_9HYPO|nr:hypothetical protein HIM_10424 [Hirsutella minnesotensis 3608]